jgi:hypothetical protein
VPICRFVWVTAMLTLLAVPISSQEPGAAGAVKPKVDIVQTVGCVEYRASGAGQWWLTKAAAPAVVREGVFTTRDIEAARQAPLGSRAYRLIGEAEYLDAKALLRSQRRADFTTADQVNATGALGDGRTVLVKGLLITGGEERINLLAVAPLADHCR